MFMHHALGFAVIAALAVGCALLAASGLSPAGDQLAADRPVMRAILERRSIRRYQQKHIPEDALREIVRAGSYAPSSNNRQKWRFIAVRSPEKVAAVNAILKLAANAKTGKDERPVAQVIVLTPAGGKGGTYVDGAAAVENMLLAAHELGIGSCWRMSFQPKKVAELFAIPPEWEPFVVVTLGYPAQQAVAVEADDTRVSDEEADRVEVHKKPLDSVLAVDEYKWKDGPAPERKPEGK